MFLEHGYVKPNKDSTSVCVCVFSLLGGFYSVFSPCFSLVSTTRLVYKETFSVSVLFGFIMSYEDTFCRFLQTLI